MIVLRLVFITCSLLAFGLDTMTGGASQGARPVIGQAGFRTKPTRYALGLRWIALECVPSKQGAKGSGNNA